MYKKEKILLERISNAINKERQEVYASTAQQAPDADAERLGEEVNAALFGHVLLNNGQRMEMPVAVVLFDALRNRIVQREQDKSALDAIDQAALASLASALNCPALVGHKLLVDARFSSSIVTYEGEFSQFKKGLIFGAMFDRSYRHTTVDNFKMLSLEYDREASSGALLGTCRVAGDVQVELSFFTENEDFSTSELTEHLRVVLKHAWQPVPSQHLSLEVSKVQHQLV